MSIRSLAACFFAFLFTAAQNTIADTAENVAAKHAKRHRLVFQVSDADSRKWNLTLINARNVQTELGKKNVAIEIVVYGPAIDMLRIESEVGPGVDEALKSGIRIVACENTMRGLHLSTEDMLPHIRYTRTGVVYLMQKQEQGYAYIRP